MRDENKVQIPEDLEALRAKIIALGYKPGQEVVNPNLVNIRDFDIRKHYGLVSLRDLKRDHLDKTQNDELDRLFAALRSWKVRRQTHPEASFLLLGDPGRGKSLIARCVYNSFFEAVYGADFVDVTDVESYVALEAYARYVTSSDLMAQLADRQFSLEKRTRLHADGRFVSEEATRLVVVDEIGEESRIPWTSSHYESQELARVDFYYQFFETLNSRDVGFFATSNFTSDEFMRYFSDKTVSRIQGMIAEGHIFEIEHLPDYRLIKTGRDKVTS